MIEIPQVVTLAAGAVTWLCGVALVQRIGLLKRYNLPAPVVGGIIVAIIFSVMKLEGVEPPHFDTNLMPPLMIGFFSSIGYGASIRDLKKGGKAVFIFLMATAVLLVLQVFLGMFIAKFSGEPPLFGVLTSAVSLVGGPGTALSFAPEFEKAGIADAASVGVAAAMLGILCGGILGAPIGTLLIRNQGIKESKSSKGSASSKKKDTQAGDAIPLDKLAAQLIYHVGWVLIIGSVGWYLSQAMTAAGIKLPFYVGSMIVAFAVRNIDEVYGIFGLNVDWIEAIGGACLVLFISVSMMTLELWSIAGYAGPLLLNLAAQAVLVCLFSLTVIYWIMGRDYDAAVSGGGMIGFMLGTTANAMATMTALTERFGPAPRAFLVVPLVGACFIDFINAIIISITLTLTG